jgi:pimeloyl-ACP methyl ester carboxylesterase
MRVGACVLLRGLGREAGHWGAFLPALAAAMPGCEVVALDLPGTGSRLRDRAPDTIPGNVEVVRAEASSRGLLGRGLLLFGVSLGGMVAMEWAGRHSAEVAGAVIAASSAPRVSRFRHRITPRGMLEMSIVLLSRDPDARHRRLAALVSSRRDLREELVRSSIAIERERPVTFETLGAQATAAGTWRAPASLGVPSLFLVGAGDRLVHPGCSRALARRYGAPLVEHPDAGHDLTTDAPEWVVDRLARFRERLDGGSASGSVPPAPRTRATG